MKKYICLMCGQDFETDIPTTCPHCGAVGDELMEEEENENEENNQLY